MEATDTGGVPPTVTEDGPPGMGPESLAFMLELGICPGASCPLAGDGCDPRCPALRAWVEEVSGG